MPVFMLATVTVAFSDEIRKTFRTVDMPFLPGGCSTNGSASQSVVVLSRLVLESMDQTLQRKFYKRGMNGRALESRFATEASQAGEPF